MAGRYPPGFVDELRARADIVSIISRHVQLTPRGGRYWGLCPFHGEKTPSFSVSPEKQMYYCFGCHASGSVYTFMQKHESMSFPEAVQALLGGDFRPATPVIEEPKPFALPEANSDMRRGFAYLTKTRGIDKRVVAAFAHDKLLYEDAKYHNVVFVGRDESGTPVHAHIRSTNSRSHNTFLIG